VDCSPKCFYLYTLGCKVNWCDSQTIAADAVNHGWQRVQSARAASVCIVNTCTVTGHADASARKIIRRIHRENPGAFIVVTGCYATTDKTTLDAMDEIDRVIPCAREGDIPALLDELLSSAPDPLPLTQNSGNSEAQNFGTVKERTRGFVKIQDGCNQFCAYCKVPYARGAPRSRPLPDILNDITAYAGLGCREVVLSGIHIAAYQEGELNLPGLLAAIAGQTRIPRLRLSSVEASACTDELLEVFRTWPAFMPHLHIPLQSGSDTVLKLMNRKTDSAGFLRAARAFLSVSYKAVITTDCMVGLPGETNDDFLQTCAIVDDIPFAKVHIFPFSPRSGTAAARMKRLFVPPKEIKRREHVLLDYARTAAARCRKAFAGAVLQVLFEDVSARGWEGFSENYLRVRSAAPDIQPNQIITVDMRNPKNEFVEQ